MKVRITGMQIVENHKTTRARFDFVVKTGDFELAMKGYQLTERAGLFNNKENSIMAYSSSFKDENTGETKWHAKSKPNLHLQNKILEEALQIYKIVKEKDLKENARGQKKIGFKALLEIYNTEIK